MNEPTLNSDDELLRRLLVREVGTELLRDGELEAVFDRVEIPATSDDDQIGRILSKTRRLISEVATPVAGSRPSKGVLPSASGPQLLVTDTSHDRRSHKSAVAVLLMSAIALVGVLVITANRTHNDVRVRGAFRQPVLSAENIRRRTTALDQTAPVWLTADPRPESPPIVRVAVGDDIATGDFDRRRVTLPDESVVYVNSNTRVRIAAARRIEVSRGEVFVEVMQQNSTAESHDKSAFEVVTPSRTVTAIGTRFAVAANDRGTELTVTQGRVQVSGIAEAVLAGQQIRIPAAATVPHSLPDGASVSPRADIGAYGQPILTSAPRAAVELEWTRELVAAASGALVPTSKYSGGALVTIDPNGQSSRLSLRKYHVDVHIEDGFARTTIDQTYFNHLHSRQEGTFHFPLPTDASLSRLAMYVNGKLMEGGMAERQHARNTFEQIVHKMQDPALLEWVDGSTFKMRVFPLEPRQEKRIVLSYSQRLPATDGVTTYRFPAGHTMDVVRDWSTHVRVRNGSALRWHSDSHKLTATNDEPADLVLNGSLRNALLNRDLVLRLTEPGEPGEPGGVSPRRSAAFSTTTHEDHRYLMLRLRPDLPSEMQRTPHHWVFLFERSADRNPLLARTQIEVIRVLLENAEHSDTFSIVDASTRSSLYSPHPQLCSPENTTAAISHLEKSHLVGALDLEAALRLCSEALPVTRDNAAGAGMRKSVLVHVGSGMPALGERDARKLSELIPTDVQYVGLGIGRRWNQSLMKLAASRTGGLSTQINPDEDVAWCAFDVVSKLLAPRLVNVAVKAATPDAAAVSFLTFSDLVFQGDELAAICRVPGEKPLPASLTVTAQLNGRPWTQSIDLSEVKEGAAYLPRHWAKLEIDRLLAADAAGNREAIVELSKSMYVMSPYTSLLVLENDEMYTQFGIDRGRKDHWALYGCPDSIEVVVDNSPDAAPSVVPNPVGLKTRAQVLSTIARLSDPQWMTIPQAVIRNVRLLEERLGERLLGRLSRSADVFDTRYWNRPMLQDTWGFRPESESQKLYWFRDESAAKEQFFDGFIIPRFGTVPPALNDVEFKWNLETLSHRGEVNVREMQDLGLIILKGSEGDVDRLSTVMQSLNGRWDGIQSSPESVRLLTVQDRLEFEDLTPTDRWRNDVMSLPQLLTRESLVQEKLFGETSLGFGSLQSGFRPGISPIVLDDWIETERDVSLSIALQDFSERDLFTDLPTMEPMLALDAIRKLTPGQVSGRRVVDSESGLQVEHLRSVQKSFGFPSSAAFGHDRRLFGDLMMYARGLNTSAADVLAVLESEVDPAAKHPSAGEPGGVSPRVNPSHPIDKDIQPTPVRSSQIDPAARTLIDRARSHGWESISLAGPAGESGVTIHYDGQGRHAWERVVSEGLREQVVCDGSTLWHVYREIGLASKRPFSRFHHAELTAIIPWLLPTADELARNADVRAIDEHTISVTPHPRQNKTISIVQQLTFASDGRLTERRYVNAAIDKLILRLTLDADGTVRHFDGNGAELSSLKLNRASAVAPQVVPELAGLVVLPMPVRTPDVVTVDSPENIADAELSEDQALSLMLAYCANENGARVVEIARKRFIDKGDTRDGLYVLLSRFPHALVQPATVAPADAGAETAQSSGFDLRPPVEGSILKQFLRQYINWVRDQDDAIEFRADAPRGSLLQQLATARNLFLRWKTGRAVTDLTTAQIQAEVEQTLAFATGCRTVEIGWTLMNEMRPRLTDPKLLAAFSSAAAKFEQHPAIGWLVRQNRISSLFAAGQDADARRLFAESLEQLSVIGMIPQLSTELYQSFVKSGGQQEMDALLLRIGRQLVDSKRLHSACHLAQQIQALNNTRIASQILDLILVVLDAPETPDVALQIVEQLRQLNDRRADSLLGKVMEIPEAGELPALWRYAAELADDAGQKRLAADRLEKAVQLEFAHRPAVLNIDAVRNNYATLMTRFEELITAAATLEVAPPADLGARIVQAADQWRTLEDDDTTACQTASRLLARLNLKDLAWDYLVTPLAENSGESAPWTALARSLAADKETDLAEMAWTRAFEFESTNPEILLEHARMEIAAGRPTAARQLLQRICDGQWQPRFLRVQNDARSELSSL